tara:strand:- start:250 stop:1239 length:990 start_codon:yes stop_codon:yes gene_type:complete
LIISKTPYRISFFGGGTDYPEWYLENNGEVISSTINKYIYLTCRNLPNFFDHKYRIVYSQIELAKKSSEIKHKVVRKLIEKYKINNGIELHYDGDLPAQSGMGSSSSFIVGCNNLLSNLCGKSFSKKKLADESLKFEQDILKEVVGSQDQIATAYGGFNSIKFFKSGIYKVEKLKIDLNSKNNLNERLILLYTGNQRRAHDIAGSYVHKLNKSKKSQMYEILGFVNKAKKYLINSQLDDFGNLLHESWIKKKELSKSISSEFIDAIYKKAIKNGAIGGKILGAGGGGFFIFYVEKNSIKKFKQSFKNFPIIPFKFEQRGSEIIFNDQKK